MIDGNDFVALALSLSHQIGEAEQRSAVSRAYYGAFHVALALITDACRIQISKDENSHRKVIQVLAYLGTTGGQLASSKLTTLRQSRNDADYKLDREIKPQWVRMQVRDATEIIRLIDAHATDLAAIEQARETARKVSFIVLDRPG